MERRSGGEETISRPRGAKKYIWSQKNIYSGHKNERGAPGGEKEETAGQTFPWRERRDGWSNVGPGATPGGQGRLLLLRLQVVKRSIILTTAPGGQNAPTGHPWHRSGPEDGRLRRPHRGLPALWPIVAPAGHSPPWCQLVKSWRQWVNHSLTNHRVRARSRQQQGFLALARCGQILSQIQWRASATPSPTGQTNRDLLVKPGAGQPFGPVPAPADGIGVVI